MKYPSICTQKGETSDVKNISNSCRNALETLYDCLFFFFLLLMYTIEGLNGVVVFTVIG